jgi:ribose transport system permease protein
MQIARGLALLTTLGKPISRFPEGLGLIMNAKVAGDMPVSVLYVFSLYFMMMSVMSLTRFGRHVYAFGGNPNAARLSGVRIRRVEMAAYVLSGIFAAIGGIMLLSRLSYADPNAGNGYEMHAIAAAVIGGISLSGGRGRIGNTLVGALILGSLTCGLQILNVPTYCQTIVTGAVIIAAVYVDKSDERKAE